MELTNLQVATRTATGNGPARVLRRDGKIPAVLYGPGREPVSLAVKIADFELAIKNQIINQLLLKLIIDGDEAAGRTAMVKELQTKPVSRSLVHVDFFEVSMDRKISVMIPVVTVGQAEGVEMGGTLQIVRRELEVLCLPGEMPESIEIDISSLGMGDSIHVQELSIPEGVEIPTDVNFTVVTVLSPKMEAEEVEEEDEGEEGEEGEGGEDATPDGDEEA